MSRSYVVNGESLVYVKGNSNSSIASLTQLGLAMDKVTITPNFRHQDIQVEAWGGSAGTAAETQFMLADMTVHMNLVHFDPTVVRECVRLSMGGAPVEGQFPHAGTLMGGNVVRFQPGNNYIGLNIASPIGQLPWRFYFSYLAQQPFSWPLGVEKTILMLNWRIMPFPSNSASDPANIQGGTILGAQGNVLYDHVLDT